MLIHVFDDYSCSGIKPEAGGVSLTAVRASSNSISGSSPGGWPQHVLPASQVAPESCIRGESFSLLFDFLVSNCSFNARMLVVHDSLLRHCTDISVILNTSAHYELIHGMFLPSFQLHLISRRCTSSSAVCLTQAFRGTYENSER